MVRAPCPALQASEHSSACVAASDLLHAFKAVALLPGTVQHHITAGWRSAQGLTVFSCAVSQQAMGRHLIHSLPGAVGGFVLTDMA